MCEALGRNCKCCECYECDDDMKNMNRSLFILFTSDTCECEKKKRIIACITCLLQITTTPIWLNYNINWMSIISMKCYKYIFGTLWRRAQHGADCYGYIVIQIRSRFKYTQKIWNVNIWIDKIFPTFIQWKTNAENIFFWNLFAVA